MENQGSFFARARQYFADSWVELKKVSFPTRQETVQATIVTTMFIVVLAVVVALLDLLFQQVMNVVLT